MKIKQFFAAVVACVMSAIGMIPALAAEISAYELEVIEENQQVIGMRYDDLVYEILDDSTIEITDCDEYVISVDIPAEINGLPVTIIGDSAFYDCKSLTSIKIPDSVTSIDNSSFPFYGCDALTTITVDSTNKFYSSIDGVLFNADKTTLVQYPQGRIDTSYNIPDGVTCIGEGAFTQCRNLRFITMPSTITQIKNHAFTYCQGLISIEIPDGVTRIEDYTFSYCNSLSHISIPSSVTNIGTGVFYFCDNLKSILLPDSIKSIEDRAFWFCGLTSIIIPKSVINIKSEAFNGCVSLERIIIQNPVCEIYDDEYTIHDNYTSRVSIYGYDGSTAEEYAKKYNRTFVSLGAIPEPEILLGDIDGNGRIDISDATSVLTIYAKQAAGLDVDEFTVEQKKASDVNGDGNIDIADATEILTVYANNAAGLY